MRSAAVHTRMNLQDGELGEWLALGETCRSYKDSCLEKAEQKGLIRLNPSYVFCVVGTQTDRRAVTGRVDASGEQAILDRLRWARTMGELAPPYGPLQPQ